MNLSTGIAFKNLKSENGIVIEGDIQKKCQKVLLSISEDIITVFEEENYWYQLGGGTALGAVRHHGFIPWDDDMDINVKSKDFEKIGLAIENKYRGKYKFLYYNVPDYGQPMGRIMLKNSIYRDRESYNSDHCGFFIDIFPIVNVPDNAIIRKIHGHLCMISGGLTSCRKFFKNRKLYLLIAKENPEIKKTIYMKLFIGAAISFISLKTCARITNLIYGLCKNENSKYVSFPSGRKHYFGEMYRREGMIETIPVDFEGHQWQVAKDFDNYFTVLYGPDYMIPHSPEKREKHILLELKFPDEMPEK